MIDTHSHIYLDEFDADRSEVVERAKHNGVEAIFMPNIDLASIEPMLALAQQQPGYCFPMMGLHPTSVKEDFEDVLETILSWFKRHQFSAVGEIGIDLYWDKSFRSQQIIAFEQQLIKAKILGLPVVIHCREAFSEVFASVEKHLDAQLTGVFHSFSGSVHDVARIVEYGNFMIGINGIVSFKNSSIWESVKVIPTNRLVVETDAPFLAPVPYRGRRNEPAYVAEVVRHLANLLGLGFHELEDITSNNARRLFKKSLG
ncbi:MAG: TatD family hydrolase [Breznakibacter sp.]|nr:TatD family hydrolase [Breznakibacter sp.]